MVTFQPVGAGHNSRVEAGLRVIKRTSKTAGFNNPAGRAPFVRGLRGKTAAPLPIARAIRRSHWLTRLARARFRVETGLKVIKRSSKTAGFNNPAGRAFVICAVDLLEPVDAFNISVPWQKAAGLKADKCRLRLLFWMSEASVARSITTLYFLITQWMRALPRPDASLVHAP